MMIKNLINKNNLMNKSAIRQFHLSNRLFQQG